LDPRSGGIRNLAGEVLCGYPVGVNYGSRRFHVSDKNVDSSQEGSLVSVALDLQTLVDFTGVPRVGVFGQFAAYRRIAAVAPHEAGEPCLRKLSYRSHCIRSSASCPKRHPATGSPAGGTFARHRRFTVPARHSAAAPYRAVRPLSHESVINTA